MRKDGVNMADYIIQLLGGVDKFLSALIVFMVINYIAEMLLVNSYFADCILALCKSRVAGCR